VTKKAEDLGAFRTPMLRDVELTAPYMHDGSEKTLLDVVRFYDRGGEKNPRLDRRLRPLGLSEQEMSDLVGFLRALTSEAVLRQAQAARPQTRSPFALDAGEKTRR
jgi:cytochrome c peroxidase